MTRTSREIQSKVDPDTASAIVSVLDQAMKRAEVTERRWIRLVRWCVGLGAALVITAIVGVLSMGWRYHTEMIRHVRLVSVLRHENAALKKEPDEGTETVGESTQRLANTEERLARISSGSRRIAERLARAESDRDSAEEACGLVEVERDRLVQVNDRLRTHLARVVLADITAP